MTALDDAIADYTTRFGDRLRRTEHRQIELYTKKKKLTFAEETDAPALPCLFGAATAFMLLDGHLEAENEEALEGKTGWQRYLALPRITAIDKLLAEIHRILRILRTVMVHKSGRLEVKDGIVVARCTVNRCAVALHITPVGLNLLESAVAWFLDSRRQPYGDAYVEAMLSQHFTDIVAEIKRFADEDRILYQFRPRAFFNRHYRFDCDNPKHRIDGDCLRIEIGPLYADPVRHPIDFFVAVDEVLHIVPAEALTDGAIALTDLPRWRARTPDGQTLPAHLRTRFGRETMIAGLPMW
ncbi:hypothetical protein Sp245p_25590 (plasmid) [Azospirillum baldaniorum]|uniref:Uncharacterized protein n=1 Tax=Azospirillum baldaniorum TaxID=1064539 RepID=A0A9P1NRG5_9PROT|nr:hypothetical protein [Azospirillum baldaniorum]AWJ93204.1 hypothetical protein Sp245p_25590 [Azospirillum baldaniorum]TWA77895.1 hypothetical protein FBZ85_10655 [Azospirillum brasilense]CCD03007.1 conserved protein of unknown function [Azospirillum baldaniorum]